MTVTEVDDPPTPSAALIGTEYWDRYWSRLTLPREYRHTPRAHYLNAILDVFDRWLPSRCKPHRGRDRRRARPVPGLRPPRRGYRVTCVDFSAIGCAKTVENFRLLGIRR